MKHSARRIWKGLRLYARLKETKAPNPLVLSGDVHLHYGADLKLDFTNPASETIGAEFTNSSISSAGDGGDVARTGTPRADFKIVERVSVPGLPMTTGGTLVMEAGKPGCARG